MGIPGALLAIPFAALAQLLLEHFVLEGPGDHAMPDGRDRFSALRYEAQHLAADVRQLFRQQDQVPDKSLDLLEEELEAIAIDLDRMLAERETPSPVEAS
jgi:hypothetical protein